MRFDYGLLAWRLAAVLWAVQIYLASSSASLQSNNTRALLASIIDAAVHVRPAPDEARSISLVIRKTAHVLEFALLGILVFGSLGGTRGKEALKTASIGAFVLSVLYAASDEFHQVFVAGRGPSVVDWLIDSAGVAAGIAAIRAYCLKRQAATGSRQV